MKLSFTILFFSVAMVTAGFANAADTKARTLADFSIRGISPGMSLQEACDGLADQFPDEAGLREKLGIGPDSDEWVLREVSPIRKGVEYQRDCFGGFKAYDMTLVEGVMYEAWTDKIDVDASNGDVYSVHNTQSLVVGKTEQDCLSKMSSLTGKLVADYGQPTKVKEFGVQIYMEWDYGLPPTVEDIGYDYLREDYRVSMKCEAHDAAKLTITTSYFSGDAKKGALSKTEVKNTFDPSL